MVGGKRLGNELELPTKKSAGPVHVSIEPLEERRLLSAVLPVATPLLNATASANNGSVIGYTPEQIRKAYGFDTTVLPGGITADGAGQTIAIIDAYNDPNIASDLATFDATFGIAAPPTLKIVSENGTLNLPSTNSGWALETSLDVEWAHAIAPGADILLVEAYSANYSDLLAGVNYARYAQGVAVVSMSWGSSEFRGENSFDSYFVTPPPHRGITFVAASGDSGSSTGAEWPSTSEAVLAVGGSTLYFSDGTGAYSSEAAWSGSTGGNSAYEPEPWWQYPAQSARVKSAPDVAYDANPDTGFAVYDSLSTQGQSGWFEIGGTSAGTPQWAALIAIADEGRFANNGTSLDGATQTMPALYMLDTATNYNSYFFDESTGSSGPLSAGAGYDLVTGLGSPRANRLIAALIGVGEAYMTQVITVVRALPPGNILAGGALQIGGETIDSIFAAAPRGIFAERGPGSVSSNTASLADSLNGNFTPVNSSAFSVTPLTIAAQDEANFFQFLSPESGNGFITSSASPAAKRLLDDANVSPLAEKTSDVTSGAAKDPIPVVGNEILASAKMLMQVPADVAENERNSADVWATLFGVSVMIGAYLQQRFDPRRPVASPFGKVAIPMFA